MKNKGLTRKLVRSIAIPTVALFVAALLILSLVLSSQVTTATNEKLLLQADNIGQETEAFFAVHAGITEQYASDPILIDYMTDIHNNPVWLDEHPAWPTIYQQLANAYALHSDTLVEFYIASYYVMDLASSTGDVMNKDYPGDVDVFHREWMVRPMEEHDTVITAPYVDGQTGNVVCTIASPVYAKDSTFLGTCAIDFLLNDVRDVFANTKVGENGYAMAFLGDGTFFYHPNEEYLALNENEENYNIADFDFPQELVDAVMAGESNQIVKFKDDDGTKMVAVTQVLDTTGWTVLVCMPTAEAYAVTSSITLMQAVILLVVLAVIILAVYFVTRKALLPVSEVAGYAQALAEGKHPGQISRRERVDNEVDVLVNSFADLVESEQKQTEILHQIARGNTDIKVEVRGKEDALNIAMRQVVDTLNSLIEETNEMTQYAILGETSYRGDESKFVGGYQRIIVGFNATLDAIMHEMGIISEAMNTLAKGETPEIVNDSQGDYIAMIDSLIVSIASVKNLVADTRKIAEAISSEDYTVRADAEQYQGQFKEAIERFNGILETVADKKIWYETILDCMDTPLQVMDNEGKWTFVNYPLANHFINRGLFEKPSAMEGKPAIFEGKDFSGITELKAGNGIVKYELDGAIYNRDTTELIDEFGVKRGYLCLFHDITAIMREAEYTEKAIERLESNLKNLASGNFEYIDNELVADEYQKDAEAKFNRIDESLDKMVEAVINLVNEAKAMADAAVAGDLDKRIDVSALNGEYAEVAKGINDTVAATIAPIKELIEVLEYVESGDLQHTVDGNYQGGHAASKNAINQTIAQLKSVISDISTVLGKLADGDLRVGPNGQIYAGDFVAIREALNTITEKFNSVMMNLSDSSEQVASGSRQLAKASNALANGTTQQAAAIQQLTATVNDIAVKTKSNAEDAREASNLTNGVKSSAERGDKQMKEMLMSMSEINESSANINKIIKVIDDIAFQTNILALNAAVEAARAGVHGKGFAVVADEVRNLAAKSAQAANETTALIEGSVAKVNAGTQIANETAEALSEIVEGIGKTASLVDRIAEASSEQATGISEVNIGIEKVSRVVTSNSATSEESAASSDELYSQAEMLKTIVSQFIIKNENQAAKPVRSLPKAEPNVNSNAGNPYGQNDFAGEASLNITLDFDGNDKY